LNISVCPPVHFPISRHERVDIVPAGILLTYRGRERDDDVWGGGGGGCLIYEVRNDANLSS
jgi:hypothetical protein